MPYAFHPTCRKLHDWLQVPLEVKLLDLLQYRRAEVSASRWREELSATCASGLNQFELATYCRVVSELIQHIVGGEEDASALCQATCTFARSQQKLCPYHVIIQCVLLMLYVAGQVPSKLQDCLSLSLLFSATRAFSCAFSCNR